MRIYKIYFISVFLTVGLVPWCSGQCNSDFAYKAKPATGSVNLGSIEVILNQKVFEEYTFKVYSVSGEIKLVQTKKVQSPSSVLFEELPPADYFIKIEWGANCIKTIGGLAGIKVAEKKSGSQ
jgi:hypothetical protein